MPSNVQIVPENAVEKVLDFMTTYVQTHQVPPHELPNLISQLISSYAEPVAAENGNGQKSARPDTEADTDDKVEQKVEQKVVQAAPQAVTPPVKRGRGRPPKPYVASPALAKISKRPVVDPRKSVYPDHLVCLIDGKKVVMIKRYLKTHFGISMEDYKHHFNLPADYPSCAPNHSEERRRRAAEIGLGLSKAA